jgi:hypothetical protein
MITKSPGTAQAGVHGVAQRSGQRVAHWAFVDVADGLLGGAVANAVKIWKS